MAYFTINSLDFDGVHVDGYFADLVSVYDHLRETELNGLGSYKTVGWSSLGSPVSYGKPHMQINHSVLGVNTNFKAAINYLRAQLGVAAFSWNSEFVDDPSIVPVGPWTIVQLFQAIGRIELFDSQYYNISYDDKWINLETDSVSTSGTILSGNQVAALYTATPTALDNNFSPSAYNCYHYANYNVGETDIDITDFGYDPGAYSLYVRVFRKTLTGGETETLNSFETAYLNNKCFKQVLTTATPTLTIPDVIDVENVGSIPDGIYRRDNSSMVGHLEYQIWLAPAVEVYHNSDSDESYTAIDLAGVWQSAASEPTTAGTLTGGDESTTYEYFWFMPTTLTDIKNEIDDEQYAFETEYDNTQTDIEAIDTNYPLNPDPTNYYDHLGYIQASYALNVAGWLKTDGEMESNSGTNKTYVYWTEPVFNYNFS